MGRGCRASPSSLEGRPGAARPSQPVDAAHRLAHPCCGSCSGQPEHAGTVGCASTPRPFLPHTPSFPDSSRRPSACRSEWGFGDPDGRSSDCQRILVAAPGSSAALRPPCSCRPRYPARDGWGLRRYSPRLPDDGTRCREVGETGAPLPSLCSGRLRRPAREERDSSRRRTSRAGPDVSTGRDPLPIWEPGRLLRPSALVDRRAVHVAADAGGAHPPSMPGAG